MLKTAMVFDPELTANRNLRSFEMMTSLSEALAHTVHTGQGVASTALKQFLTNENTQPIFGHVVFDNIGSQRVLEKCGFVKIATDHSFASMRGVEIDEYIYKLSY